MFQLPTTLFIKQQISTGQHFQNSKSINPITQHDNRPTPLIYIQKLLSYKKPFPNFLNMLPIKSSTFIDNKIIIQIKNSQIYLAACHAIPLPTLPQNCKII